MKLYQASILLVAAALPSSSVGKESAGSSALLFPIPEGRRGLGSRSRNRERHHSGSDDSKDHEPADPPFTNPPSVDVCLVSLSKYTIEGSSTAIGGATKVSAYCPPYTLADAIAIVSQAAGSTALDDYLTCLATPEAGPVIVGKWWFNRDNVDSSFVFKEGRVCATINVVSPDSKTKFELWDEKLIDLPLGHFEEFSVDYNVMNAGNGGSKAYVNVYMRTAPESTEFYDCRLNIPVSATPPATGATGRLIIDATTTTTSIGKNCGPTPPYSIGGYLTANPGAVLGVGNGEYYAFTMDTGSTGQDNQDLEVCWSDVLLITNDGVEGGAKLFESYEFTTLK